MLQVEVYPTLGDSRGKRPSHSDDNKSAAVELLNLAAGIASQSVIEKVISSSIQRLRGKESSGVLVPQALDDLRKRWKQKLSLLNAVPYPSTQTSRTKSKGSSSFLNESEAVRKRRRLLLQQPLPMRPSIYGTVGRPARKLPMPEYPKVHRGSFLEGIEFGFGFRIKENSAVSEDRSSLTNFRPPYQQLTTRNLSEAILDLHLLGVFNKSTNEQRNCKLIIGMQVHVNLGALVNDLITMREEQQQREQWVTARVVQIRKQLIEIRKWRSYVKRRQGISVKHHSILSQLRKKLSRPSLGTSMRFQVLHVQFQRGGTLILPATSNYVVHSSLPQATVSLSEPSAVDETVAIPTECEYPVSMDQCPETAARNAVICEEESDDDFDFEKLLDLQLDSALSSDLNKLNEELSAQFAVQQNQTRPLPAHLHQEESGLSMQTESKYLLATGEEISVKDYESVERFYSSMQLRKRPIIIIPSPITRTADNYEQCETELSIAEDPTSSEPAPDIIIMGRLQKMSRREERWSFTLYNVYIRSAQKQFEDVTIPRVQVSLNLSCFHQETDANLDLLFANLSNSLHSLND